MIGMHSKHISVLLLAATFLLMMGCGSPYSEVTGSVTCDGSPLPRGRIIFVPETGRQVIGKIVDGRIVDVTTSSTGDGALVGKYRVCIFSFVREPKGMEVVPSAIAKKYNDAVTSGLEVEITNSEKNEFNFDLDPM